eukprot:GHVU01083622.1.p2 GENE.GHVU01083622.1~~GHVU01083622.1.p2  ORF type:complete len:102 (+),score=11.10 GHVU01083622.1:2669-2974(+)
MHRRLLACTIESNGSTGSIELLRFQFLPVVSPPRLCLVVLLSLDLHSVFRNDLAYFPLLQHLLPLLLNGSQLLFAWPPLSVLPIRCQLLERHDLTEILLLP